MAQQTRPLLLAEESEFIKARDLAISWGNDERYWRWINPAPGSNAYSADMAELLGVWWFDIRGRIESAKLKRKTSYGAYLVFFVGNNAQNLEKVKARTRFVKDIAEGTDDEAFTEYVTRTRTNDEPGVFPVRRSSDGWLELKVGEFYNSDGEQGQVDIRIFETSNDKYKTGIFVAGIELRPF